MTLWRCALLAAASTLAACGGPRQARPAADAEARAPDDGTAIVGAERHALVEAQVPSDRTRVVPREVAVAVEPRRSADADGDSGRFDASEIDGVVRASAGQVKRCYQQELDRRDLAGKIVVRIEIAADGTVARAVIHRTTMNDAVVEECVRRVMLSLRFAPKGPAVVSYPFIFSPG